MLDSLYKYLVLNSNVAIPGVGTFNIGTSAATFDSNKNSFSPPAAKILFEPGTALTDKNFYQFLSGEMNITEVDAVRKFQDFAYQLRKDIQSFSFVELTGIGKLEKNALGHVEFKPDQSGVTYFPAIDPVNTVPIIAEEVRVGTEEVFEHQTIKKDRWWIWALVLSLAAATAIVYYFSNANNY